MTNIKKTIGQSIKTILRKKGYEIRSTPFEGESNRKLIFIHIPKTGGKTLSRFLRNQYQSKIHVNSPESKKIADLFDMEVQIVRKIIFMDYLQNGYNFISGHIALFPEFWEMKEKFNYSAIIMLRDPVDRYFSHYFYNYYKRGDHFRIDKDFDQYLESERGQAIGSLMTSYLCGIPMNSPIEEKVDSAKRNLERFDHIGILEKIDEFTKAISPFIYQQNKPLSFFHGNKNPADQELYIKTKNNPEYRAKIEEICQADVELYNYAQKLIENKK